MPGPTSIEWATHSWNPVTGCTKVSPGCAHCYAETFAERWRGIPGHAYQQGFDLRLWPSRLEQPLRWRRPRRIFVNSMSDLFHEEIPDEYIHQVLDVMGRAHWHTFMVLTKRAERMRDVVTDYRARLGSSGDSDVDQHVWLGVSIENRRFVHRADLLRDTPAAVRFISAEPLLGPLLEPEAGWDDYEGPGLYLNDIDLLIVGGESGPGARPMRLDWARELRDATRRWAGDEVTQLDGYHCAFFLKQLGGHPNKRGGDQAILDGKTWHELPTPALEAAPA